MNCEKSLRSVAIHLEKQRRMKNKTMGIGVPTSYSPPETPTASHPTTTGWAALPWSVSILEIAPTILRSTRTVDNLCCISRVSVHQATQCTTHGMVVCEASANLTDN